MHSQSEAHSNNITRQHLHSCEGHYNNSSCCWILSSWVRSVICGDMGPVALNQELKQGVCQIQTWCPWKPLLRELISS